MKVNIAPAAELQELRAENAYLRNRNLILAQAVQDLRDKQAEPPAPAAVGEPE